MARNRVFRRFVLVAGGTLLFAAAGVRAERALSAVAQNATAASPRASYTLTVTRDVDTFISLETDGARLSEVAADLSKRLGVPIVVSAEAAAEVLRTNFSQLRFETALSVLASRAFVDYELGPDRTVPLQVHLRASADPPVARGSAMGILIEGDTETVPAPGATDPLRLSLESGRLTIVAERQPLRTIVAAVAEMLNVPYESEYPATETMNVQLVGMAPEIALLRLSPNILVYVRADLFRGERTVQRIRLAPRSAR